MSSYFITMILLDIITKYNDIRVQVYGGLTAVHDLYKVEHLVNSNRIEI